MASDLASEKVFVADPQGLLKDSKQPSAQNIKTDKHLAWEGKQRGEQYYNGVSEQKKILLCTHVHSLEKLQQPKSFFVAKVAEK